MNFQTMNRQRKLILFASLAGIISIFLPWFSAGAFGFSVHVNGFHGWGILAFLCFVAALVISLVGNQPQPLDKSIWFVAMICGALCLLSVIITILSSQTADYGFASAGLGFGIWIALVAAIAVTAFAWMFKNPADNLKGGFDSLKKTVATSASAFSNTNAATTTVAGDNKIAELERLSKLKESGSITEEEFQQLKSKLI
jgi:hypothetical protein